MAQQMIHEILPVGMLQCNCSILGDPETREALVIDPGDEVDRILEVLRRHSLIVRAIVSTHAHIDHVGGLRKMQQVTGAPVLMHGDDMELYRHLDVQAAWLGTRPPDPAEIDKLLREGDTLRWGKYSASVLHTPGHTPGSVSLYLPPEKHVAASMAAKAEIDAGAPSDVLAGAIRIPGKAMEKHVVASEAAEKQVVSATAAEAGKLLAGDTLFAGSIGRTDLWGGSMPQILRSIHNKLLVLPDETLVYPGHGEITTIGRERESNPYLELAEGTGRKHALGE